MREPHILLVDDEIDNLVILKLFLKHITKNIVECSDPRKVKSLFEEHRFDIVLLDISMPYIDGIEICKWIKSDVRYQDTCVIFTTGHDNDELMSEALDAGGMDYLIKPVRKHEILARTKVAFRLKRNIDEIHRVHAHEHGNLIKLKQKNQQLNQAVETVRNIQGALVFSLSKLAESRDNETGKHLLRTQNYVEMIAQCLKGYREYSQIIDNQFIYELREFAPLHDIGKVGIPDEILKKGSRLTPEEFEIMKKHPQIGAETLVEASQNIGHDFLKMAIDIVYYHHEKNDGSGYPKGLKGDEIPLAARIMSIADIYDALRSRRCYKEPFSHDKAVDIILESNGTSFFHPDILKAFSTVEKDFAIVADRLKDD